MYTQPSLQGRCHFGERVLSIFMVKIIANFKAVEGWGEKEICTKGVGDGPRGIQGKEWGDINYISPFPTPYPTVFSKSKSNMAGRINDRELIKLTRPHCRLHPAGRSIACLISDLRPVLQR